MAVIHGTPGQVAKSAKIENAKSATEALLARSVILDSREHRFDVDDRSAVDGFDWADQQPILVDPLDGRAMQADWIRAVR